MSVVAYDSVSPDLIPQTAIVVCGYIDGLWAWPASAWSMFPRAKKLVRISTLGDPAADFCDFEAGNASAQDVAQAGLDRMAKNLRPGAYCDLANIEVLDQAYAEVGIPVSGWDLWAAGYDGPNGAGQPWQYPNAVMTQFVDTGPFDLSLVNPTWFSPTPQEPVMQTKLNKPPVAAWSTATGDGYLMVCSDGGVVTLGDAKFYGSLGGQTLNAPIVTGFPTPTGKGYTLVGEDGGVFTFGDAKFEGSEV